MTRCDECGERVEGLPIPGKIALCEECFDEERRIEETVKLISREIGKQMLIAKRVR